MARHAAALPSTLPAPVFGLREALALGVCPDRLRRRDVMRIGGQLFARAGQEITELDVVACLCRVHGDAVACGPTAARLWQAPLPRDLSAWTAGDGVHLLHPTGSRRPTTLVTWHRGALGPADMVATTRARVTSAPRTWADLAPLLGLDDLVAVGDCFVRRPRPGLEGRDEPWTTLSALAAAAESHTGRGARALREALALVRVGSDSPAETRLRLGCRRAGLPEPLANARILEDGSDLGEPDLQWRQWKVCLEHEGPHHLTPAQLTRDIRRAERRHRHGWIEVRTTAPDLARGGEVGALRARDALLRHGWRP